MQRNDLLVRCLWFLSLWSGLQTPAQTQTVHYVNPNNPIAVKPYTRWVWAARNIQDAVDAADPGDVVLVTNGVYQTGGRNPNEGGFLDGSRVFITNAVTLQSVNGPEVTIIDGVYSARCLTATTNALISGFTLTRGMSWYEGGGGAYGGTLTNCTISHSAAGSDATGGGAYGSVLLKCRLSYNWALKGGGLSKSTAYNCELLGNLVGDDFNRLPGAGGGAYASTLYSCTLFANGASKTKLQSSGGGADSSTLYNCTLTGNSTDKGGGAYNSTLYNCTLAGNFGRLGAGAARCALYNSIVYDNQGERGNYMVCTFAYCCTTPSPSGVGNIDADPRFAFSPLGVHPLKPDSPCIDSAASLVELIATDILGFPRGGDGNGDGKSGWDMGAYEYDRTVPIITQASVTGPGLTIEWNAPATGATLQRTTSLSQPDWQDLLGSEKTNRMVLPVWSGSEFFRLVKP